MESSVVLITFVGNDFGADGVTTATGDAQLPGPRGGMEVLVTDGFVSAVTDFAVTTGACADVEPLAWVTASARDPPMVRAIQLTARPLAASTDAGRRRDLTSHPIQSSVW